MNIRDGPKLWCQHKGLVVNELRNHVNCITYKLKCDECGLEQKQELMPRFNDPNMRVSTITKFNLAYE